MRVADSRNIFRCGPKRHGGGGLADQVASGWTDDVHAQNSVACGVGQHLYFANRIVDRTGPAVGAKWKHALFKLCTSGDELLFRFPNRSDFWVCEDDCRHEIVVDVIEIENVAR